MTEQANDGRICIAILEEIRDRKYFYFFKGKAGEHIEIWKLPLKKRADIDKDNLILEENAMAIQEERKQILQRANLTEREAKMEEALDAEYDVDAASEGDYGRYENRIDYKDDEDDDESDDDEDDSFDIEEDDE